MWLLGATLTLTTTGINWTNAAIGKHRSATIHRSEINVQSTTNSPTAPSKADIYSEPLNLPPHHNNNHTSEYHNNCNSSTNSNNTKKSMIMYVIGSKF